MILLEFVVAKAMSARLLDPILVDFGDRVELVGKNELAAIGLGRRLLSDTAHNAWRLAINRLVLVDWSTLLVTHVVGPCVMGTIGRVATHGRAQLADAWLVGKIVAREITIHRPVAVLPYDLIGGQLLPACVQRHCQHTEQKN